MDELISATGSFPREQNYTVNNEEKIKWGVINLKTKYFLCHKLTELTNNCRVNFMKQEEKKSFFSLNN